MDEKKIKEVATEQGLYVAAGAALGAVTHQTIKPRPNGMSPPVTMQVASAMGAAAVGGAGVSGSVAAGAAVVTAKVAAAAALATAAAPFVLGAAAIGAVGWGLFKLFEE